MLEAFIPKRYRKNLFQRYQFFWKQHTTSFNMGLTWYPMPKMWMSNRCLLFSRLSSLKTTLFQKFGFSEIRICTILKRRKSHMIINNLSQRRFLFESFMMYTHVIRYRSCMTNISAHDCNITYWNVKLR